MSPFSILKSTLIGKDLLPLEQLLSFQSILHFGKAMSSREASKMSQKLLNTVDLQWFSTDGLFTTAVSNSLLSPLEKIPKL